MSVVDDVVALVVIGTVYTKELHAQWLLGGIAVFAFILALVRFGVRRGFVYLALGVVCWVAMLESGVEPIVVGLAMGLLTYASPAARTDLERATELFRRFREQPTPELAQEAQAGLRSTISPNERLQRRLHPWTSYAIVPLFALANAGVAVDAGTLRDAFTSPITLGILFGYVVGKPLGILGCTYVATRLTGGRLRPPVGWAAVAGGGAVAGIGFTVALLVASLAFEGADLEHAKIGVLASALAATTLTWLLFRATALLPRRLRITALAGGAEPITDLYVDVDVERDHFRGPADAPVTLVEYGDFQCPYCGMAEPVVRELLSDFGDVRYVWRHLPLNDVHRNAQIAAEASEAAADQGKFWEMHDLLLHHQDALTPKDLVGYAEQLGLDVERFTEALRDQRGAARIAEDVDGADLSGVSGTPTFFVNGRRHHGAYDIATLTAAVKEARLRASLAPAEDRGGE
jgi:protein-disulfide isomerase